MDRVLNLPIERSAVVQENGSKKMTKFSLSKVASKIKEAGFNAVVEMTGGNCGTIFVGEPDLSGLYTTACGAGSYADDCGWYEEFYIGKDGEERGFYFHDYNAIWTEDAVAKAIIHAHKVYLSEKASA
jgi:hypothetical protein